jgi:hypothetical protein
MRTGRETMTVEVDTTARAGTVPMTPGDLFLYTVPLALVAFGCVLFIREVPLRTSSAVADDDEDGSR